MATVRKRGKSYQIDYFDPNGKRVRKSFKKKKDAEAVLGKCMSLIFENKYNLDIKKEYKTKFGELVKLYKENQRHKKSYKTKKIFIESNLDYFGEKTLLTNIKYLELERYMNHLRLKPTIHGTVRSDVSINSAISCLRQMFKKAVAWDMIEQSPFDKGESLHIEVNNQRIRYLEEDEIELLINECLPYMRNLVECALNTGMRIGEILSLKWNQVRNGFIYLKKTKSNKQRQIPINDTLAELFDNIKAQRIFESLDGKGNVDGLRSDYVFSKNGKPFKYINNTFNAGVRRAGIEDFTFHDLRHTFASHFVMRGGSLKDLQEILGHKTMTMTLRYAHLSQEHKKKAINLLNDLTAPKKAECHKTVTSTKANAILNTNTVG